MVFGIEKNNYGINSKEWRQLKKDLKTQAKNGNIDLRKKDLTDLKQAIETNNLGVHLDQIAKEMKGVLGLHLTGKVDGTEDVERAQTVAEITEIINNVKFEDGVDTKKVLQYVRNANVTRVQGHVNETIKGITEVNAANVLNNFEIIMDTLKQ